MKKTKTIENILDYSTDYEFFKYIYNFEVYFQPRVNTAINKQVFSEHIGKILNEVEGLDVYFNPLTGDMSIHDRETGEVEMKKFHQFVSGKVFTIESDLYDNASNYQLKKDFIQSDSIRKKIEDAGVFKATLKDAVSKMYGEENATKIKYAYLFNTSMFVGRDDMAIENILQRSFNIRDEVAEETRNFILLQKGFMNGHFDSEEMNPFALLDDISDLTNVSLKVYYERPINYSGYDMKAGRENGYYLDVAYMDPSIILYDERTQNPIYKGDSVLIATEIALKKFNNEFHPFVSKDASFEEKVTKIAYYEYVETQAKALCDYLLSFTPADEKEEITYDRFEDLVKEIVRKYKHEENKLLDSLDQTLYDKNKKETTDEAKGVSEFDLVLSMLDNIGDLRDYHGYVPKDKLDALIKRANFESHFKIQAFDKEVSKNWDNIAEKDENWDNIVDKKSKESLGSQMTFIAKGELDEASAPDEKDTSEKKVKKSKTTAKAAPKKPETLPGQIQMTLFDELEK